MSVMDQMRKLMKEVESMEIQALRAEFHRLYGDIPHPVNTRTLKNRIIYRSQFQKDWLFPVNNSFSHVPSPS